jgi:poly(3-hydroxybutyrate) depolymerase
MGFHSEAFSRGCTSTALGALSVALLRMANAATSVELPNWVCTQPDGIYASSFDATDAAIPHDPSLGTGGLYPGKLTRTLYIAGLGSGTQNYYLYVPSDYTPERSWPLMLVLHGVAPYGQADSYASTTRDNWVTAASAGHFIVAAPVANAIYDDQYGNAYAVSWLVPPTVGPNDYDLFAAVRADLEGAYNIERTRIYGWGFSAGAHVMHDLGVNTYSDAFNANTMAAYSVSAGVLQGLACPGPTDAGCGPALAALSRRIPVDIHIGTSDPNYQDAVNDHALFQSYSWQDAQTIHFTAFVGGHTYTIGQLSAIWNNLCPNAVTP